MLREQEVEWAYTEEKLWKKKKKPKYLWCGEMECYGANVVLYA